MDTYDAFLQAKAGLGRGHRRERGRLGGRRHRRGGAGRRRREAGGEAGGEAADDRLEAAHEGLLQDRLDLRRVKGAADAALEATRAADRDRSDKAARAAAEAAEQAERRMRRPGLSTPATGLSAGKQARRTRRLDQATAAHKMAENAAAAEHEAAESLKAASESHVTAFRDSVASGLRQASIAARGRRRLSLVGEGCVKRHRPRTQRRRARVGARADGRDGLGARYAARIIGRGRILARQAAARV